MLEFTLNGEARTLPEPLTVADLIDRLGYDRRRIAVEVNREVVPVAQQPAHRLASGDAVEIVTLVGGGAPELGGSFRRVCRRPRRVYAADGGATEVRSP